MKAKVTPGLKKKVDDVLDDLSDFETRADLSKVLIRHRGKTYGLERCTGEAHSNAYIDNCWDCAPLWGVVVVVKS